MGIVYVQDSPFKYLGFSLVCIRVEDIRATRAGCCREKCDARTKLNSRYFNTDKEQQTGSAC